MSWGEKKLYYDIILPFSEVLEEIEYHGIKVDVERVRELKNDLEKELKEYEALIYDYTGVININSSQQLAASLYDRLNIPDYIVDWRPEDRNDTAVFTEYKDEFRTESGARSTNVFALKKIKLIHKHPVADYILEYKQIKKLLSTYIDGIFDHLSVDNRVHPSYFMNTKGGRISVSSPNVATIPSRSERGRKIKSMFVADEGHSIIEIDYKAMELRFMAWMSKDPVMYNAFFVQGLDVHAITTAQIFGITYEEAVADKAKRFIGKTVNFLIVYGGGAYVLQQTLLKDNVFHNMKECTEFLFAYYDTYKSVKSFQNKIKDYVLEHGYVKNLFGRRRFFDVKNLPVGNKEKAKLIKSYTKQGMSHVIQGSSSADYSAYKTVLLQPTLKALGGRVFTLLYDGIYASIPDENTEAYIEQAPPILVRPDSPVSIECPVDVSAVGKKWSEL